MGAGNEVHQLRDGLRMIIVSHRRLKCLPVQSLLRVNETSQTFRDTPCCRSRFDGAITRSSMRHAWLTLSQQIVRYGTAP